MHQRGVVRVVASALTAAGLWLVIGLIDSVIVFGSIRYASVVSLVVTPTVPGSAWQQIGPWNVVLPVLSALAFGGLVGLGFALIVRHSRWSDTSRLFRVVAAWFIVVVASSVTAAAWTVSASIAEASPVGLLWAFQQHVPDMFASASFGLVWGWLPALLVALPSVSIARRSAALLGVVSLVVALIASGALAASMPVLDVQSRVAAGGTPDGRPTPSPTPPAKPAPPPRIAPIAVPPQAGWCSPEDVTMSVSAVEAALGHRAVTLTLVNRSGTPCTVDGYPDLAFADAEGGAVEMELAHGSSYLAQDPGESSVQVPPGGAAEATIGWAAGSAASDSAASMLAAIYPGVQRTSFGIGANIDAGSAVDVTAWAPLSHVDG